MINAHLTGQVSECDVCNDDDDDDAIATYYLKSKADNKGLLIQWLKILKITTSYFSFNFFGAIYFGGQKGRDISAIMRVQHLFISFFFILLTSFGKYS